MSPHTAVLTTGDFSWAWAQLTSLWAPVFRCC